MGERYNGLPEHRFMDVAEATVRFELSQRDSLFSTELDKQLVEHGIAKIEMPLSFDDFDALLQGYEICIEECPEILQSTFHKVDNRHGNEAGHVRKERTLHPKSGIQTQDPKNYFHFNEQARNRWGEQLRLAPAILRTFLEEGYEIHNALLRVAQAQFAELEETHPNISSAYFSGTTTKESFSFLRLLSYDGYEPVQNLGEVAKPHFDISGIIIQAYADAPGFWGSKDGPGSERTLYENELNEAYLFVGYGHKKLYGKESRIRPLWHGVDRVIPAGLTYVPKRHAVILFVEAPFIDYKVTPEDTLPYIENRFPAHTNTQAVA